MWRVAAKRPYLMTKNNLNTWVFFFSPKHEQIKLYKYYAFTPGLLCHCSNLPKHFSGARNTTCVSITVFFAKKKYTSKSETQLLKNERNSDSFNRWDDAEETGGDVSVQADGIRL